MPRLNPRQIGQRRRRLQEKELQVAIAELGPGQKVLMQNLTGAVELNGEYGRCEDFNAEKGRWNVRLRNGEIKALKPDNLIVQASTQSKVAKGNGKELSKDAQDDDAPAEVAGDGEDPVYDPSSSASEPFEKRRRVATPASLDEFVKLTERVNSAAQKLGAFKKDTESRKKKAQLQEAGEKITLLQAEAEKVSEAMKPIMEKDADTLSAEEASTMVKGLEELEKGAQAKVVECRAFLAARARDAQGDADNTKIVQELQTKLTAVQADLAKAKKLSSTHNQKLTAKALIQEAGEQVKAMEAELAKATAACAPLLEEKCERFLVKFNISTMCAALREHMDEHSISEEDMHKKMGSSEKKFVKFLAGMAEEFKKEELSWPEARRNAIFKIADADGDGKFSFEDFQAMFKARFVCVHEISVTDVFEIGTSKTVCKLAVGTVVEGIGGPKKAADGVPRLQCKLVESGEQGWVTTQGNGGTKYLDAVTPFKVFAKELNVTLEGIAKANGKVASFFGSKLQGMQAVGKDSPLLPAKEELTKLKLQTNEMSSKFSGLRQKVEQAKREFPALELKEKNAHIEAKERKEADAFLAPTLPVIAAVDEALKKLEEAAKPLTERQGTDLLTAFATPISVQNDVNATDAALKKAVTDAKAVVKEKQLEEAVAKAVKGPMLEAKKDLQKSIQHLSQATLTSHKVLASVKACCNSIAKEKLLLAATTIRKEGVAVDDLFAKLAPDGARISEENFAKYLQGLKGLDLSSEHAALLARQIEADGIGRRSFSKFLQVYYKVIKEIAITPVFDVVDSKEKPVRKAEADEVLELLEGPQKDEKSGLDRARVRALKDGVDGWISIKGNQGKVFLVEVEKPYFYAAKDLVLEKDFKSDSTNAVRPVKADEIMELLEGPRSETLGSVMRLRAKASLDGKVGWFTMKDQNGTEFAEKDGKFYTCTATVAITDVFDIKECKVLKKLSIDETFLVSEGPVTEASGLERVKGKSTKDETEGWITIKGNAGTTYAKVNEKLYTVKRDVPMQVAMKSDSAAVRTLAANEAIEVLDGPKEERFLPSNRVKVRLGGDRSVGWLTMKADSLRQWKHLYRFVKAAPLYSEKARNAEKVVREAVVGETFEFVEGPIEVDGGMWLKLRAKKDLATGWAPMKSEEGARIVTQLSQA